MVMCTWRNVIATYVPCPPNAQFLKKMETNSLYSKYILKKKMHIVINHKSSFISWWKSQLSFIWYQNSTRARCGCPNTKAHKFFYAFGYFGFASYNWWRNDGELKGHFVCSVVNDLRRLTSNKIYFIKINFSRVIYKSGFLVLSLWLFDLSHFA